METGTVEGEDFDEQHQHPFVDLCYSHLIRALGRIPDSEGEFLQLTIARKLIFDIPITSTSFVFIVLIKQRVCDVGLPGNLLLQNPISRLICAMAQQRRVVIQNNHGEKLVGILHDTGSDELVIVCHGFQSSKEQIPMINLSAAFEKEGISVFHFDFAGNGESEGSFQYGNYRREADDLRVVVQQFHGKEHIVTAIIGHSKGGNVVLLYASKYDDIHSVVNISGRFNLERGIEGRLGRDFLQRIKQKGFIDVKNRRGKFEYRVTEESLMDRLTTNVRAACLSIPSGCRVLTVHGSMDKIVPAEDALEFSKSIANHDLCIIEGADHDYTSHQDELASIVVNFVKENLCLHKGAFKQHLCRKPDKGGRSRL